MDQLRSLVQQSFEVFNVYGKEPEAAKAILHGFSQTLDGHSIEAITQAFQRWMRESSAMPTPADIRKIVLDIEAAAKSDPDKVEWIQVIRDYYTDAVLEKRHEGQHLSPFEIDEKYKDRHVRKSMERNPPLPQEATKQWG